MESKKSIRNALQHSSMLWRLACGFQMVALVKLSLYHARTPLRFLGYGRGRNPQPEMCPYRGPNGPLFRPFFRGLCYLNVPRGPLVTSNEAHT
jgi:hypothetical protein